MTIQKNINRENIKNAVTFLGQSKLKCPGLTWDRKKQHGDGELDIEIIPLLQELNKLSFLHTTGSCSGHSLGELKNKEKGWGVNIPYRITLALHVKITKLKLFSEMVRQFVDITDNSLWCEFGYHDDYNNRTESGYIPFQIVIRSETKIKRDKYLTNLCKFIKEFAIKQNNI